jgi:RNA polymerase sigma-70 factor (ECF subfamily)
MPVSLTDRNRLDALFARVQANDASAFALLHAALAPQMMAYCLSFTRDFDAAEDVFQSVMVAVFEHRHSYNQGNLTGWLFTIARNACRTWEQQSRRFVPLEADSEPAPESSAPFDADEISLIQREILKLPAPFRSAVLLHYFGELSVADIAAAEGISPSLVKIRLFRARKLLARSLRSLVPHLS